MTDRRAAADANSTTSGQTESTHQAVNIAQLPNTNGQRGTERARTDS